MRQRAVLLGLLLVPRPEAVRQYLHSLPVQVRRLPRQLRPSSLLRVPAGVFLKSQWLQRLRRWLHLHRHRRPHLLHLCRKVGWRAKMNKVRNITTTQILGSRRGSCPRESAERSVGNKPSAFWSNPIREGHSEYLLSQTKVGRELGVGRHLWGMRYPPYYTKHCSSSLATRTRRNSITNQKEVMYYIFAHTALA
jgi:hypothetical protein